MAKISHPNFVDTINDILIEAKKKEVILLESQNKQWHGDTLHINEADLINLGTCGYLGLETHPKIIEKTIEFTKNFGTQFSISRSYVISQQNKHLENLLSQIFNSKPVIVFTSTTLTHISILPIVVSNEDAIILDQQSHISIQNAAQLMAAKGVPIEVIRHSSMEMLEYKIKTLYDRHDKIWYMIDGVYSMYGDIAPIEEINALLDKYPKLHLYVDDAHGMSWYGKNGCGRIYEDCEKNNKTIYVSTLAKGFGTMGGLVVFPNQHWYQKVCMHGGPLAYSHPIPPPMLGASIASAEIHLSSEIYDLQNSLKEKLQFANSLFEGSNLPLVSNPETPIFFVGTGQPTVGYNINSKIIQAGYYVNIGLFPAVPIKNTGLRFTINNHLSPAQIEEFIQSLKLNYPKALKEEGKTLNDVLKAFKLPLISESEETPTLSSIHINHYQSIQQIDKTEWNNIYHNKGNFDWDALCLLETSFSGNEKPENNWNFYYVIIKDEANQIVLSSFFTEGLFKDDMLSSAAVSQQVEIERLKDPYYLCSKTLTMGSLFTEGDHLYLNKSHPLSHQALKYLMQWALKKQDELNANTLIMRDFDKDDHYFDEAFHVEGFFKLDMPNSNVIDISAYKHIDELIAKLSAKNRRHYKEEVFRYFSKFEIEFKQIIEQEHISKFYELYNNVSQRNRAINIFSYPKKLIEQICNNENWETVCIYLKTEHEKKELIAVCFSNITDSNYTPTFLGINYNIGIDYKVYKQLLYQLTKRAIELKKSKVYLGLSADTDKKKIGAQQFQKCAYLSIKDNFNMELLNNIFTM